MRIRNNKNVMAALKKPENKELKKTTVVINNKNNKQSNDLTNFHEKKNLVNKILKKHNVWKWGDKIYYDYEKNNFVYTDGKSLFISKLTEKEKKHYGSENIYIDKTGKKTCLTSVYPNYARIKIDDKKDKKNVVIDWHELKKEINDILKNEKEIYKKENYSLRGFKDVVIYCRFKIVNNKLEINTFLRTYKQKNSSSKFFNLYFFEKLVNCMILFRENENNFNIYNWNTNDYKTILLENDNIKLFFMSLV